MFCNCQLKCFSEFYILIDLLELSNFKYPFSISNIRPTRFSKQRNKYTLERFHASSFCPHYVTIIEYSPVMLFQISPFYDYKCTFDFHWLKKKRFDQTLASKHTNGATEATFQL